MCEVIAGQSPDGGSYNAAGEGMPFYQGKKDFGERYIGNPTAWTTQPTKFARDGDILMSVRAPVGPVNLAAAEACIGRGLAAIRPRSDLNRDFLFYQLLHLEPGIAGTEGAVFPSISRNAIEALAIAYVSLPEQQRIVGILDKAFEGIAAAKANAEKNRQNARALFDSHLQSVFADPSHSWVKRRLDEVALDFGRGRSKHRPRNDPKLYGGKYPFVQTGDVRSSRHLIETYSQTYNDAGLAQSKLWPAGTLCITIAANIAETGILAFDACFPDSVIGVVADEHQTGSRFLEYMLQSFRAHLQTLGKGSAQANINLATFANQLFPFPSLHEQSGIVETLDALRIECHRLESVYQRELAALDELKKSLLHQAFSGQLCPHLTHYLTHT